MANRPVIINSELAKEVDKLAEEKGMTFVGALNYIVRVGFFALQNPGSTGKKAVNTAESLVELRDRKRMKASPRELLG